MNKLVEFYHKNKQQLIFALIAAFIWGMAAHGYVFLKNNFSHDSLREFHAEILGNEIKIGSGRFLTPFYRELIGNDVTLPWMAGLLAIIWIGLAVFFVIRLFQIDSNVSIFLLAGVFSTNIAVSATAATYIHDLDCYMFSMLCAVLAAYLWRTTARGWLAGSVLIMVSLGIYQSFLFVAVTLVMIACIMDLLNDESAENVILRGSKAILMILVGGLLYYLIMKLFLRLTGMELTMGDYNSLDTMTKLNPQRIVELIGGAYSDWFYRLIEAYSSYPSILVKAITLFLFAICFVALLSHKMKISQKLLCLLLVALLPAGMNMIYVLTDGHNHDLMTYPIFLFYLLAMLLSDLVRKKWRHTENRKRIGQAQYILCLMCMFVLLYGNVRFSNGMYMKKDMEHDAYVSLMTRVLGRMEGLPEYNPGKTPVVFVGLPENLNDIIPGFKDYWNVIAMTSSDVIYVSERSRFQAFFDYVMGTPMLLLDPENWIAMEQQEFVQQMPCYPEAGCMLFHDGILIVKLGN